MFTYQETFEIDNRRYDAAIRLAIAMIRNGQMAGKHSVAKDAATMADTLVREVDSYNRVAEIEAEQQEAK